VLFEFADKRTAPKRGDYRLRFAYATRSVGNAGEPGKWRWSLPRWPNRLANVQIRVLAALGTEPSARAREQGSDRIEVRELGQRVELSFWRIELPRTQAFVVSFERPVARASPARLAARLPLAPGWPRLPSGLAPWLGLSLGLLWLVKRRLNAQACRAVGMQARALLPLSAAGCCACASFALCASAVVLFDQLPLLAAIGGVLGSLLAIDVARPRQREAQPGHFRAVGKLELAQLQTAHTPARFSARDVFDATTPTGIAAALALYALLAGLYAYDGAAVSCSACLVFAAVSERHAQLAPPDPAARLARARPAASPVAGRARERARRLRKCWPGARRAPATVGRRGHARPAGRGAAQAGPLEVGARLAVPCSARTCSALVATVSGRRDPSQRRTCRRARTLRGRGA